jgi:peptide/nickel transport system permease protein
MGSWTRVSQKVIKMPTENSPLNITASTDSTRSRRDVWSDIFDRWIYAPFMVMWTDWRARVGMLIVVFYILIGTVGVAIIGAPKQNEGPRLQQPFQNSDFFLGTDALGQDMLEMLVHATPAMLKMIIAGAVFSTVMATIVGVVAGYKGGVYDRVLSTITDIVMTIPGLPLLIVLAVAIQPRSPWTVGLLLSVNAWAGLARSLRSQVLTLRSESYIEASRALGLTTPTIISRDILPNLMPYILINFMGSARRVIFESVGLYFLGVLPFTTVNWGVMMNMAYRSGTLFTWNGAHWLLFPMIAISLLTFGMILVSQGMDRVFNPRVRARHAKTTDTEEVEAGPP